MLSHEEKQKRLDAVQDAIGTHRAEGITVDPVVHELMMRFADGDMTFEQFSAAVDRHAEVVLAVHQPMAGAA